METRYSAIIITTMILFSLGTLVPTALLHTESLSEDSMLLRTNTTIKSLILDEETQLDVQLTTMHFSPSAMNDDGIYFVCRRGTDTVAYFGVSQVYYCVDNVCFSVEFPGSNGVVPVGEEPTGSVTNYLLGKDPENWRTGLEDCSVLRYYEIYPGIDLVYKIQEGNMKYEFVVQPGADPSTIQMRYPDADSIEVRDDSVSIVKHGQMIQDTGLWAFQSGNGVKDVSCIFHGQDESNVIFSVGEYDRSQELIIDPAIGLAYSTFIGGSKDDYSLGIVVEDGYAYITGYSGSSDFPIANAYDATLTGTYDCFVTKFSTFGQSLVYSTFLGGSSNDYGYAIAVEDGYAYVTGRTGSSDFPTANAYDSTLDSTSDCFVTKFATDGQSLVYSTFLGGSSADNGKGIAVEDGYAYITGVTYSSNFPTASAYDSSFNTGTFDCFVTKFATNGQSLVYSTFLGGSSYEEGHAIAVENGYAYVTGYTDSTNFPTVNANCSVFNGVRDCFVTKFATNGQSLIYSSFLGGTDLDWGYGIAVEEAYVYVTGYTGSSDFLTDNAYDATNEGGLDCFVTKFTTNGQSLIYSTYLGGSSDDVGSAIAVEEGYAYVIGYTGSSNFPLADAYDASFNGGTYDCFVTEFTTDGQSLVYSTFLGGSDYEYGLGIAVENGYAYITGHTYSVEFPTINAYESEFSGSEGYNDCFVSVLSLACNLDSDSDGLTDWEEAMYGTNPYCIDSDNDNFLDAYEIAYGSDPNNPLSYPAMPQSWYNAIYEDLDGNATLIQNLITWSEGNTDLLQTVMDQLDANATLLQLVISWLDGNHTAIETLFTYVQGNATLLLQIVDSVNANSNELILLVALVTHNSELLATLNATYIGDINEIYAILDALGVTVGDTDYDGLDDLQELALGTDFQCIDTDCDNLNDAYEVKIGTDPTDDDSDNDTYLDGAEVLAGTDPLDPADYPGQISTTTTSTAGQSMGNEIIVIVGVAGIMAIIVLFAALRRRSTSRT